VVDILLEARLDRFELRDRKLVEFAVARLRRLLQQGIVDRGNRRGHGLFLALGLSATLRKRDGMKTRMDRRDRPEHGQNRCRDQKFAHAQSSARAGRTPVVGRLAQREGSRLRHARGT
jgi:hypothetical protein